MNLLAKRLIAVGSAMVLGAVPTACGVVAGAGEQSETAPSPSVAKAPQEVLLAAVPSATTTPFRYRITGGEQPMSGLVDAPKRSITADFREKVPDTGITLTMQFLIVDDEAWTKIAFTGAPSGAGLPEFGKKWMKLDPAKTKSGKKEWQFGNDADPGQVGVLVRAATGLTQTAPGRFAGVVDLTRAADTDVVDEATLKALGAKAKAAPFTAEVDDRGRLTKATVRVPAAGKKPAATFVVTYDQYGVAPAVRVPSAKEQVAAPKSVYEMLDG